MDEGDRPTESGGSAGRNGKEGTESEERSDGAPEGPSERATDEGPERATGGDTERATGGDTERATGGDTERATGGDTERATGGDTERATGEIADGDSGGDADPPGSPTGRIPADEGGGPGSEPGPRSGSEEGEVGADSEAGRRSAAAGASDDGGESLLYRFRHDRDGALMWIREMLSSVAVVLLVGLLLFGVSGIWPPMVAVESGSMEPNMEVGDLVFVTEPGRLAPDAADNGVGVVTHEVGETVDYRTFGSHGSVVIYTPPGRTGSPIIHRAMFHVSEGENWYDRADEEYHSAVDCGSLANCPAPHDGFVTLGDNNGAYDQASGLSPPVKAEWVDGVARLRVPYLGYIRLIATGQVELNEAIARTVGVGVPGSQAPLGASSPAA